jgi:excisionase family DNA binding protein
MKLNQPPLLTFSETARRLSISVRTLARWVADGHFPTPLRFGHPTRPRVRFRLSDIEHFLNKGDVVNA